MWRMLSASLIGLVAVLLASCPEDPSRCTDPARQPVTVQYSVDPAEITPFPSDLFTVADTGTRTGLRVALSSGGAVVLGQGLGLLRPVNEVVGLLNERDGFSLRAPVLIPVSGPIDVSSLPATPEASVAPESSVFLLGVSPDGTVQRVPVVARAERYEDPQNPVEHVIVLMPRLSLLPEIRHVVVVTREVLDLEGRSVGPSEEFLYTSGQCTIPEDHPRAAPLAAQREATAWLYAPPVGLVAEDLAVAVPFTTQSATAGMDALREQVRDPGLPDPVANFDATGDGMPDVYAP